jgi:hypothetical protein
MLTGTSATRFPRWCSARPSCISEAARKGCARPGPAHRAQLIGQSLPPSQGETRPVAGQRAGLTAPVQRLPALPDRKRAAEIQPFYDMIASRAKAAAAAHPGVVLEGPR